MRAREFALPIPRDLWFLTFVFLEKILDQDQPNILPLYDTNSPQSVAEYPSIRKDLLQIAQMLSLCPMYCVILTPCNKFISKT